MLTMVLIASGGLMLTMFLMRRTASLSRDARSRRDDANGIRWRGINWQPPEEKKDEDA
jgi:hypothetical protein